VQPCVVDGATLFISRTGDEMREFLFTDMEQAYQSGDLAMLARHLVATPVDQDYDKKRRHLLLIMESGTLSTLTLFRREKVTAWSGQETNGLFRSVAMVGDHAYVIVERNGSFMIEVFDDAYSVDSGLTGSAATPKQTWSGLDHLEGQEVTVVGDGSPLGKYTVTGGEVTLAVAVSTVEVGLSYAHIIEPLPHTIASASSGTQGGRMRPISFTFRVRDATGLRLDIGNGLYDVAFKRFGGAIAGPSIEPFTGDKKIQAFGWRAGDVQPLWRIEQDTPAPFTLLSVASIISLNG